MTEPVAGAMPVAAGATPAQTPAQPAPQTGAMSSPATGDDDGLGDAGKRAIAAERKRAEEAEKATKALQAKLEELENSSKSEHEKAIAQAKKDGAAEALTKVQAQVRRSEVRAALTAAGISASMLDLATKADEFASLEVNDSGEIVGLSGAVEAFKKAVPELFAKPAGGRGADFGGGPRGAPATSGTDMNTLIRRAAGRA